VTSIPTKEKQNILVSIVLPCFNEVRHGYLERILSNLQRQEGNKEIIFAIAPGGDRTEEIIRNACDRLEHSSRVKILLCNASNRAQRLNRGIESSMGEIVLLHNPATLLPEVNALENLQTAMAQRNSCSQEFPSLWGGFHHSFDMEHWLLGFTSWYSNHIRAKRKGIVYFDHCLFADRQLLNQVGNVPDMDIFEDTELSKRLRQFGMPVLAAGCVTTSARRFRQRGVYQQAFLNQMLKVGYQFGLDPRSMNKLYEQKVAINSDYGKS
jgi:glycosyltransferase involved in cell wall biosynthesis